MNYDGFSNYIENPESTNTIVYTYTEYTGRFKAPASQFAIGRTSKNFNATYGSAVGSDVIPEGGGFIMNTDLIIGSSGGGGGKGGGGSYTPVESPDTLKSQSFAEVVDLLCEGEIVGLVDGIKSIYINNIPIQNSDGTLNYEESGFQYYFRTGTQDQDYIPGFETPQAEIPVGREVKFSSPVTEPVVTSAEENVDFVRVTIDIPALVHYADNGDTNGSEVQFNIDIIKNGISITSAINKTVIGKTTSNYQLSYLLELPRTHGVTNEFFSIKVTKLTNDSATLKLQNTLKFASFTKVSNTKMRYPNSALCAMRMASSQFNSIPKRGYHVKLLKVKIPRNYNPETRVYTGIWDGTFEDYAWTNNPAWCYYDLITNERYGLGEYISEDLVDKWSLYTIAQYCDELVPTGFKDSNGTDIMEPRFTLNTYIQERQDAIKLLYDIASAFRGMIYWTNGTLHTEQDSSSSTPTLQFTNSNVVGGTFTYSGASKKVVHTAALVTWNDPQALYEQKIEYVEDRLGIERYGYNPTEIIAFGCTSRGQAVRAGNWLLYTERVESNIVSFSAGLESVYCTPGTIIKIFDEALVGVEYSGRIVSSLANTISLDRGVTLATGETYSVRLSMHNTDYSPTDEITTSEQIGTNLSYYTETFNITDAPGSYETLTLSRIPSNLLAGATWSIYSTSLNEKLYRVVSLKESDSIGVYEISAMLHNPDKFAFIENNIQLEERTYSTLSVLPEAVSLGSIVSSSGTYRDSSDILRTSLTVGFSAALYASSYTLEIKRTLGNWVEVYTKKAQLNYTFYDLSANEEYAIKITPFNIVGKAGPSTTAYGFTIDHNPEAVGNSMVTNFKSTLRPTDLLLEWDAYPSIEQVTYTIRKGASYETSSEVYSNITGRSQAIIENTVGTYTYWIIAVFTSGDYTNPTRLDIYITDPLPVVDVRSSGELNQNSLGWEFQETKVGTLETEIWSNSTNNRDSSTKLISLAYPTSTYTHTGLESEQTVYYWLRVKDTRGNASIYYPFSNDKGLKVTTRIGTPEVLGLIAGSITSSELHADLNDALDSVDEAVFGIDGETDGLIGTYSVKIDSGGKVAGYGLYNDATSSRFIVSANEFAITTPDSSLDLIARNTTYAVGKCVRVSDPPSTNMAYKHLMLVCKSAGTSHPTTPVNLAGKVLGSLVFDNNVTWQVASRVPISVFATGTSIDQTTVYPGVYIDGATILNATINSAQINDAAITTAKIDNAAITTAKIGKYIISDNFTGEIVNDVITTKGNGGWGIDKAGNAYFTNAIISGQITVGSGSIVPYSYVQSGPPANATVGATWGSNLLNQPTDLSNLIHKGTFEDGLMGDWPAAGVENIVAGTPFLSNLTVNARDTVEVIPAIPVTADERIFAAAWLRTASCNYPLTLGFKCKTASGVNLWMKIISLNPLTEWTYVKASALVPAGAVTAYPWIQLEMPEGTSNQYAHLNDLWIGRHEKGATVGATWGSNLLNQPTDSALLNSYVPNDNLWTGSLATRYSDHNGAYIQSIGYTDPRGNATAVVVKLPVAGSFVVYRVFNQVGRAPGWYNISLRLHVVAEMSIVVSATDASVWANSEYKIATTASTTPEWVTVSLRQYIGAGANGLDVIVGAYHGTPIVSSSPADTTVAICDLFVYADGYVGASDATKGANSTNLAIGLGTNFVPNSDLAVSAAGWSVTHNGSGGTQYTLMRDDVDQNWYPLGGHTLTLYRVGDALQGWIHVGCPMIPVIPGKRYEVSAYVSAHRANGYVRMTFYDATGTYISSADTGGTQANGTGASLLTRERLGTFMVAPPTASTGRIELLSGPMDGPYDNIYLFATRMYMGEALPNQTELSPWSPAGYSAIDQLGYVGDSDATRGAPAGTYVGNTLAEILVSNADAAQLAADAAQLAADAANGLLADIASDSKLTATEKQQVLVEWSALWAEKGGLNNQAEAFNITTENTTYNTAISNMADYINPMMADITATSNIVGDVFRTQFAELYAARQTLLNKVAQVAATRATWDSVASRPMDVSNLVRKGTFEDNSKGLWPAFALETATGMPFTRHITSTVRDLFEATNKFPVTEGETLYASAWMQSYSAGSIIRFGVAVYNVANAVVQWLPICGLASGNTWQKVEASGVVDTINNDALYAIPWLQLEIPEGDPDHYGHFADLWIGRHAKGATVGAPAGTYVGGTLAETLVSNANSAILAANTANAAISNIASDSILSPVEKPRVVQDHAVIMAEQAGIDAQAEAYVVSHTAYDAAIAALVEHLATIPGWNTVPGEDVGIVGPTFRAKFADVYTSRQAVLNAISAAAKVLANNAALTANWSGVADTGGRPANYADVTKTAIEATTTITGGGITLSGGGSIKTLGKDSASNTTAGLFLGWDTSAYQFTIGNATQNIKWNGSTLSLTGSAFDVSTTGNVHGGQTDYNTGSGFFLGYSGGAQKFSMGNPTGSYMTWDGTNLTLSGAVISRQLSVASGTVPTLGGAYPIQAYEGWKLLKTVQYDTGYVLGAWHTADDLVYQAAAGVSAGTVVLWATNSNFGTFYANWTVKVKSIFPKSRWWNGSTLMLELELWAEVDGACTQIQFPAPSWKVLKVT